MNGTNTGDAGFGASGNEGTGLEFRDGPEDMARMQRYEAYLNLQAKAGGLTDAQYLAELDRIMEPGDRFDKADGSYSKSGPGSESGDMPGTGADDARQDDAVRRVEIHDSLEALDQDPEHEPGVPNDDPAMLAADAADGAADGTELGQAPGTGSDPDHDGADGYDDGVPVPGSGTDGAATGLDETEAAVPGDGAGDDLEQVPGAGPDEPMTIPAAGVADPDAAAAPEDAGPDAEIPGGPGGGIENTEAGGPGPHGGAAAPDDPEAQVQATDVHGPQAGQGPAGPGIAPDAAQEPVPDGPGMAGTSMHIGGQTVMREEQYQVHDALDEISVATGLASSVQTAEYIPPRDITVEPAPGGKSPDAPVPGRSALAQKVIDIDNARYAQPEPEAQPDGPGY